MFGLHRHKWVNFSASQIDGYKFGIHTETYVVLIQQCEVCGKIRRRKVSL